ncbi:CRISPR-associated endonuclease Cas3'' [Actinacidiphila acididurans]|uniref:CRISPR-associated endonuclease Cas3 n=1 Tax=Actinacidiphila acididurans TaxID=2784346 RepID=A0ABS2TXA6_9ACTN|nr:CRISPR-associated endonuclease Cas3'' [Actinacidiphila acididurans]MBM9507969.1 CRISPR-associated endonuclease Cas3'' [Actinacidiphila acididurans]
MDDLLAHSSNRRGNRHRLTDHLRGTESLAYRFGSAFGAADLAGYLGLVHDVGKGYCSWQNGLLRAESEGGRVGPDHKSAGTHLAAKVLPFQFAGIVEGHHGGLRNNADLKNLLKELRSDLPAHVSEAITRVAALVPQIERTSEVPLPSWATPTAPHAEIDLLIRMAYSAVVDADFLDTRAHFSSRAPRVRDDADMEALAQLFEIRRKAALAQRLPSPVDTIREDIYQQAMQAADGERGIYRLHIPTGGGKTFAGAGFALCHARRHGMRRVIVAVPFISITQQNADVYRDMLDPATGLPNVLEHHSSANPERGWARLAAENWDAPFVITTTVQLFESLFAHTPARMRKLHRLAGAVIVLDEVQSLPDRLLVPILSVLRTLTERFGATVLLSSATQPEFWATNTLKGLPERTVIDAPAQLFKSLRRVRYEWRNNVTLTDIATEAAQHSRMLMVVNSTKDANAVHRHLGDDAYHLSTRMTAGHRRDTINEIRTRLKQDESAQVQVVSTSLIEAGVDLDFPTVYRAWALPESIQQAAGRCNRDGHLEYGTTIVFHPTDGAQPHDRPYQLALSEARHRFGKNMADPDNLEALAEYYAARYSAQAGSHTTDTAGGLGEPIEKLRTQLHFPAVAENFQMINDRTVSVVVLGDQLDSQTRAQAQAAIDLLRSGQPTGPETLRTLQPHTANIPSKEADTALANRHATTITDDLLQWTGAYHHRRGIEPPFSAQAH